MKGVPKEWALQTVGHYVERLDSGTSVNCEERPAEDAEPGMLKLSCVTGGRFAPSENKAILPGELNRARTYARGGRILVSRSNTLELVGASALVPQDYPKRFVPDTLWQTVFREGIEFQPSWLAYVLSSPVIRRRLRELAAGTSGSMKKLTKPAVLGLEVLSPPFPEQCRIAEILQQCDRLLETTERLLAAKARKKRGIVQQVLTGKMRFKEFKNQQWRTCKLGELFRERIEIGRSELPLLSITTQNGIVPRDSLAKRDTSSEDKSKYLRIAPGDIGYNTMRMWQGVSGLSKLEGIVSPAYTICIPSHKIDARFASYLFKYAPVVNLFRRHSQGLVDDTLSLKFPNFARIQVTIPNVPEQVRIAAVLETCDREIELLQKQLEALKEQKRGLMQKLLTGQIPVKVK